MRILTIGDIHGNIKWINLIPQFKDFDKVIFMGDYFDSFTEPIKHQIIAFKKVVELIKSNPNKFIGLWGNHDLHYLKTKLGNLPKQSSGFQEKHAAVITILLEESFLLFKAAHQETTENNTFLFTHAGITPDLVKAILEFKKGKIWEEIFDVLLENDIDKVFNFLFDINCPLLYYVGPDREGKDTFSGMFWCDKSELDCNNIYTSTTFQVVGHTYVNYPHIGENNCIFVDSLKDNKILKIVKITDNLYAIN